MKIDELKEFPKSLLKKKHLTLYKAFVFENAEDEMKINTNIDVLAITKEAAIIKLLSEMANDAFTSSDENFGKSNAITDNLFGSGMVVSLAIIKLDTKDLLTKDIIDNGDVFFENDLLSITLQDKIYVVDVEDVKINKISVTVDSDSTTVVLSDLEYDKA